MDIADVVAVTSTRRRWPDPWRARALLLRIGFLSTFSAPSIIGFRRLFSKIGLDPSSSNTKLVGKAPRKSLSMLSSGRLRIRISPQRPQMIHSGTARSLSLSLTMALSSSTEDRSLHYPRTSHVPTAHLWGSGSAGRRTSDLHPQSPNILQFRMYLLLSAFLLPPSLPRPLPPPTSIQVIPSPRILIGGSLPAARASAPAHVPAARHP